MRNEPQNSDSDQSVRGSSVTGSPLPALRGHPGWQAILLFASCLAAFLLVAGAGPSSVPNYEIGDTARSTIRAVRDFQVEDQDLTRASREEALRSLPIVLVADHRIASRLEEEVREVFRQGRRIIPAAAAGSDPQTVGPLVEGLQRAVSAAVPEETLQVLARNRFTPALEEACVERLRASLAPPGVVYARDVYERYLERGILIRNSLTSLEEELRDPSKIRELGQAKVELVEEAARLPVEDALPVARWLAGLIKPNLSFDESRTRALEESAARNLPQVLLEVQEGQTLVNAGQEITADVKLLLEALERGRRSPQALAGVFLLVCILQLCLWSALSGGPAARRGGQIGLVLLIQLAGLAFLKLHILGDQLLAGTGAEWFQAQGLALLDVAPLAYVAILTALLAGLRSALASAFVFAALSLLMTGDPRTALLAIAGGFAAALALNGMRGRKLAKAVFLVGLINSVVFLALSQAGAPFGNSLLTLPLLGLGMLGAAWSAVLALLSSPAMESLFRLTTDLRLKELSDLGSPLLRRLAAEAPGTFHHSVLTAALGEAAARAVAANPRLVLVAALYHDVGKLSQPDAYLENQVYGRREGKPFVQADLGDHLGLGVELSRDSGLPQAVQDMISQHHGTMRMSFLRRQFPDPVVPIEGKDELRYPGPKPSTREAAILLLCDQLEAASRGVEELNLKRARTLVKRIIRLISEDGQLDECEVTMGDLGRMVPALSMQLVELRRERDVPGSEASEAVRIENQRVQ